MWTANYDQTVRIHSLILGFAGAHAFLLEMLCHDSKEIFPLFNRTCIYKLHTSDNGKALGLNILKIYYVI